MIDQLALCLPNEPGRLAKICKLIGDESIQIHAIMVADCSDFGLVRFILDRPHSTAALLASRGYNVTMTRVVAVEVDNVPGGLGRVLDCFASCDLNVEYAYTCSVGGTAIDVIRVTGEPLEVKLAESGLRFLTPEELYIVD